MRSLLAALVLALFAGPLPADIVSFPISSDFDAEFARAVDLIEAGQRAQAQRVLEEIESRSGQPAWKARVEMLLAADDERIGDFQSAARHLAAAPAATIGLEPYRRLRLGRVLARQGHLQDAQEELTRAFESDEPFAIRAQAGEELARVLEKRRKLLDALRILARAWASASREDAAALGAERIRLARAAGDVEAVRAAARDLVTAGVDPINSAAARQAVNQELSRGTPAERGRFARSRIAAGDFRRGVQLLKLDLSGKWPSEERAANLLALARGLQRTGQRRAAEKISATIPSDGSEASFEARLWRADLLLGRLLNKDAAPPPEDPSLLSIRQGLLDLISEAPRPEIRARARERLVRIAALRERFDDGLTEARRLLAETPEATASFEPLWKLSWKTYLAGNFSGARSEFGALAPLYTGTAIQRRLSYWTARCFEQEGRPSEAIPIYRELSGAAPADLYALFARRHAQKSLSQRPPQVSDPSTATATYRKTDELLRLRFFPEAVAEARSLTSSRGRDRRLAQAEFALGHFPAAAAAAKRAFPEIGTSAEAEVPDAWRRLYYPIEFGGFLTERAQEFGLEPSILRGLVRQESIFQAAARSKAGALGLTQLMPATAKSLSRSVLRQRYRKAFLYDPKINARLGAAYLKRLLDRFGGKATFALAAYNGGPSRMARVLHENANRPEDEIFESHPAYETRDYVRRVLLFAESYRELYPATTFAFSPASEIQATMTSR